jgi:hypothetical protein
MAFKTGQIRKLRQHARSSLRLAAKCGAYLPNNHEQDAPRFRRHRFSWLGVAARIRRGNGTERGFPMMSMVRAGTSAALAPKIAVCLPLVAAADFLFFDGGIGWTLGLYGILLLTSAAIHNPALLAHWRGKALFLLGAGTCLALVESLNLLALALFALCFGALLGDLRLQDTAATVFRKLAALTLHICGGSVVSDAYAYSRYYRRTQQIGVMPGLVRAWLLPLSLSAVFVVLFAAANPVIDKWLLSLDLRAVERLLTPERVGFWCIAAAMCWGVLRSARMRAGVWNLPEAPGTSRLTALLFSGEAVLRSLALFNLMFLGQNLLDANFLWAGGTLPEGVTYAEYAHRGAYPLVLTALLAAAFVLIAMRRASALNQDRAIRWLIYLWLLQNMVLVFASIWRTNIYVAEYSLTYLRLSALLWMGLVLLGLIYIVLKIVLSKSSRWLIGVNLATAFTLLYATCFVDLGRFIADYNVAHCREMQGSGYVLDMAYLRRIGPSALPALHRLERHATEQNLPRPLNLNWTIEYLAKSLDEELADWRRWTFRAHRLARELGMPQTI